MDKFLHAQAWTLWGTHIWLSSLQGSLLGRIWRLSPEPRFLCGNKPFCHPQVCSGKFTLEDPFWLKFWSQICQIYSFLQDPWQVQNGLSTFWIKQHLVIFSHKSAWNPTRHLPSPFQSRSVQWQSLFCCDLLWCQCRCCHHCYSGRKQ